MKVFISIDIEGITGVYSDAQTDDLGSPAWLEACRFMRADLDAALEGCVAAGAREIVVCDAHYKADNLSAEGLPPVASLVSGAHLGLSMMAGLDASFDAALCVGYHAMAGVEKAVQAHTYTDILAEVLVVDPATGAANPTGELGINAALAGTFGVPVVFASGDDRFADEATTLLPQIEIAVTKQGLSRSAARLSAPAVTAPAIRDGVRRALTAAPLPAPLDWNGRSLRVRFGRSDHCDGAAACPGVARLDGTTVEIAAADYRTVFSIFVACTELASA